MKTQQRQLEEILAQEGWQITERESPCLEWWLDEVWTIESVWSPVGLRGYVSFLVDPEVPHSGQRRKGEYVWAVAIGLERADAATGNNEVPLRPNWESVHQDKIPALLRQVRSSV